MENIEDLVFYLKPNRKRGEPDEELLLVKVTESYDPVIIPEDETLLDSTFVAFRNGYKKLKLSMLDFSYRKIYVINVGGDVYRYYLKNDDGLYKQIEWGVTHEYEPLVEYDPLDLTEVVIKQLATVFWHVETEQIHILLLPVVEITNTFPYDPDDLDSLKSGNTYMLEYINDEGHDTGIWDGLIKNIFDGAFSYLMDAFERRIELNYHNEEGVVYKYPSLFADQSADKYRIYYEFYKINDELYLADNFVSNPLFSGNPIFSPEIRNADKKYAITLEFGSIFGFLSFIKKVYFDDEDAEAVYSDGDSRKSIFYQSYIDIVDNAIERNRGKLNGIYKLYYYIPMSILAKFDPDYLWDFLERAIVRPVSNYGINKEDVVVKILRILAANTSETRFLEKLRTAIVKGEPLLSWFVYRLDGDNFKSFVYIVWSVWKTSKYSKIDSNTNTALDLTGKSPIVLPYTSDKTMCFHHDNASIDWSDDYKKIKIDADIDTVFKIEVSQDYREDFDKAFGEGASEAFDETFKDAPTFEGVVKENYVYHPYAPVAIVNEDNPHFIFKDKENPEGQFTLMPAFVMLAREESAFWSNVVTALEYAVDILTTFSGFGNIIKAGRLFKLLKAGKTLTFTAKVVKGTKTVIKGFAGVVEISSGVGNGLLKLTGARDTPMGRAISEYLFYLEMISLTGEITAALGAGLRKAAQKAIQNTSDVTKFQNEALAVIKKNTDSSGKVKKTEDVVAAQQKLEALEHLKKSSGNNAQRIKLYDEFLSKWKGKKLSGITRVEIIKNLRGFTAQGDRVADLIQSGKMKIKLKNDKAFNKYCMKMGDTLEEAKATMAFAIGNKTFFRNTKSIDQFMTEVVHEGTHVLDNIAMKNAFDAGKSNKEIYAIFGDSVSAEKRAYFHERAFQKATDSVVEYEQIPDLINHAESYIPYSVIFY